MFPLPGSRGFTVGYGQIRARSFKALDAGTASAPAYELSTAGNGVFDEVTRVAVAQSSTDRAYWSSSNHDYVAHTFSGAVNASNSVTTAGDRRAVTSKTANYTAADTDGIILCDPTSGNITIALPAAASGKQTYVIKKTVAHANTVVIDPNGAETIDGAATKTVADNTSVTIISDGTNWHTISSS